jgi:alpha-L-fucosidase
METQVTELLTNYGPVAGIWLDGEGELKSYAKKLGISHEAMAKRCGLDKLYAKIRSIQPQCLISYKKGIEGSEDFGAPEHSTHGLEGSGKLLEICSTIQKGSWGYSKYTTKFRTADDIMSQLAEYAKIPANLNLNTGPKGDGSFVQEEIDVLREVGRRRAAQI